MKNQEIKEEFDRFVKATKEKLGATTWQVKNQIKIDGEWVVDFDADDWDVVLVGFNDGHTEEISMFDYLEEESSVEEKMNELLLGFNDLKFDVQNLTKLAETMNAELLTEEEREQLDIIYSALDKIKDILK